MKKQLSIQKWIAVGILFVGTCLATLSDGDAPSSPDTEVLYHLIHSFLYCIAALRTLVCPNYACLSKLCITTTGTITLFCCVTKYSVKLSSQTPTYANHTYLLLRTEISSDADIVCFSPSRIGFLSVARCQN